MGVKYSVNEKFFDSWSPIMAYVLGYIYADGNLENSPYLRGKYLRITSTDRDSIERIKDWLESDHSIVQLKPWQGKGKMRYFIRIGSHAMYDSLTKHGLYPKKSLTVKFPHIPRKFVRDFIRGYFDGDGCVYFWKSNGKQKAVIARKLSIIFTSGSKNFLESLEGHFRETLATTPRRLYSNNRAFQLRYATADSILIFTHMYSGNPIDSFFPRKVRKFLEYFKFREDKKLARNTQKVIKYLGAKVAW